MRKGASQTDSEKSEHTPQCGWDGPHGVLRCLPSLLQLAVNADSWQWPVSSADGAVDAPATRRGALRLMVATTTLTGRAVDESSAFTFYYCDLSLSLYSLDWFSLTLAHSRSPGGMAHSSTSAEYAIFMNESVESVLLVAGSRRSNSY